MTTKLSSKPTGLFVIVVCFSPFVVYRAATRT